MTKEQLEALGLTEDQIKEVFRLNGIAVNNAKGDASKIENDLAKKVKEVEALTDQLDTANTQISEFKKLNVEDIQKAADDYKEKYEAEKLAKEQEIAQLEFDYEVKDSIIKHKGKNPTAIKALLDIDNIKEAKDRQAAIKEALEEIAKENDYLFEKPVAGTGGTIGNRSKDKGPGKVNFGKQLAQDNKQLEIDTSMYEL